MIRWLMTMLMMKMKMVLITVVRVVDIRANFGLNTYYVFDYHCSLSASHKTLENDCGGRWKDPAHTITIGQCCYALQSGHESSNRLTVLIPPHLSMFSINLSATKVGARWALEHTSCRGLDTSEHRKLTAEHPAKNSKASYDASNREAAEPQISQFLGFFQKRFFFRKAHDSPDFQSPSTSQACGMRELPAVALALTEPELMPCRSNIGASIIRIGFP